MEQVICQLKCPLCKKFMKPPILQCNTGHSICIKCRTNLNACPICNHALTNCKNITLETLATTVKCFQCVNANFSCTARLTLIEKDAHELVCKLDTIRCPIEKCKWSGRMSDLSDHWKSKNFTLKPYKSDNVCHAKLSDTRTYYANLLEAHDKVFLFKCMSENGDFFWAVQHVGNVKEAELYYYEIEVFKPGRWKNKFTLSSYCQPISMKNENLFVAGVCTYTPIKLLEPYMNDEQSLIYYLRVKCVDDSKNEGVNEMVNQFIKFRAGDHSKASKVRRAENTKQGGVK